MPNTEVILLVTTKKSTEPQPLKVTLDHNYELSLENLKTALKKAGIEREPIVEVVIPEGVTSIGHNAFVFCQSLTSITSITISGSVTSIVDEAFFNCKSLTSITISGSETSIGGMAFFGCTSLTSITILCSVENIGAEAFYWYDALKIVFFANEASAEAFKRRSEEYFREGNKLRVIAPSDLETWVKTLVKNKTYKEKIAASYGKLSFEEQVLLYKLSPKYELEPNNKPLMLRALQMLLNDASISKELRTLIPHILGKEMLRAFQMLLNDASMSKELRTLILHIVGKEVATIKIITAGGEHTLLVTLDERGVLSEKNLTTALKLEGIKRGQIVEVVIPEGVTSIGNNAFVWCQSLTSITIPERVTSIGKCAFVRCKGLTSVTILGSETSIDTSALDLQPFFGCRALKFVFCANEALAQELKDNPDKYTGASNKPRVIAPSDLVEDTAQKKEIGELYDKLSFEEQVLLYKLSPSDQQEPNKSPLILKAFQMSLFQMLLNDTSISKELRTLISDIIRSSSYSSLKRLLHFLEQGHGDFGGGVMKCLPPEDLLGLSVVCKNLGSGFFANKPIGEGSSTQRPFSKRRRLRL